MNNATRDRVRRELSRKVAMDLTTAQIEADVTMQPVLFRMPVSSLHYLDVGDSVIRFEMQDTKTDVCFPREIGGGA